MFDILVNKASLKESDRLNKSRRQMKRISLYEIFKCLMPLEVLFSAFMTENYIEFKLSPLSQISE